MVAALCRTVVPKCYCHDQLCNAGIQSKGRLRDGGSGLGRVLLMKLR